MPTTTKIDPYVISNSGDWPADSVEAGGSGGDIQGGLNAWLATGQDDEQLNAGVLLFRAADGRIMRTRLRVEIEEVYGREQLGEILPDGSGGDYACRRCDRCWERSLLLPLPGEAKLALPPGTTVPY